MPNSIESVPLSWTAGLVRGVMVAVHATLLSPSNYFNLEPHTKFPAEIKERKGNVLKGERQKILL